MTTTLSQSPRPTHPARLLAGAILAILGGLAIGAVTNVLQGLLPGPFQAFSNSGSVWVVGAFAAGAVIGVPGWRASFAGIATQVGAVVGYYGYAEYVRDGMGDLTWPTFWLVLGLIAGPIFGTAGAWWRTGTAWRRLAGPAVLGAVFGMDALHYLFALHYYSDAISYGVIGVALPLLLGRTARERLIGAGCAVALAFLALGILLGFLSAMNSFI
ncbi:DUF6518 family protein [Streptomyces sp. NPDC088725]|uniref:DUF6518 family protein n=1 Tax=Streptomyces sp. NPDC088725 TaxID=3365873 RepID=UPI00380EE2B6